MCYALVTLDLHVFLKLESLTCWEMVLEADFIDVKSDPCGNLKKKKKKHSKRHSLMKRGLCSLSLFSFTKSMGTPRSQWNLSFTLVVRERYNLGSKVFARIQTTLLFRRS